MPDFVPMPEPGGSLEPPDRFPPTAIGTAMLPPREPVQRRRAESQGMLATMRQALERVFDYSDELAARIRRGFVK